MEQPGGVAEWPIALVLKTSNAQAFEGSNPSPSAPALHSAHKEPAMCRVGAPLMLAGLLVVLLTPADLAAQPGRGGGPGRGGPAGGPGRGGPVGGPGIRQGPGPGA